MNILFPSILCLFFPRKAAKLVKFPVAPRNWSSTEPMLSTFLIYSIRTTRPSCYNAVNWPTVAGTTKKASQDSADLERPHKNISVDMSPTFFGGCMYFVRD
ncbi:hypothetical protein Y032_0030g2169 [Ancylostoma ceylanicum]|uniref:Secreted protein n=1 Tax=Ancylostoma ceylanicum TaxID=53326 RepID=A0A016UQD6_9BILA|nr:hypothetical protein Y032_0030g2169 [Ancylostoma ceylanicum]